MLPGQGDFGRLAERPDDGGQGGGRLGGDASWSDIVELSPIRSFRRRTGLTSNGAGGSGTNAAVATVDRIEKGGKGVTRRRTVVWRSELTGAGSGRSSLDGCWGVHESCQAVCCAVGLTGAPHVHRPKAIQIVIIIFNAQMARRLGNGGILLLIIVIRE